MKTKEELQQLKTEYEALSSKLKELSKEEILEIVGGNTIPLPDGDDFWDSFNPMDPFFRNKNKDGK